MSKAEATAFLEGLEAKGIRLGLERVSKFMEFLGSPEKGFKAVHIAGTNGKGSTAAMLESILRKAGYRTGLYTSPHLVRLNERVQVNGKPIADRALVQIVSETRAEMEKSRIPLTYFEFLTAAAFRHFASQGIEFGVIETGLGGRLDATNIIKPAASVITNVEREHEALLGNSVEEIALEKAGIVKEGIPLITAEWKKPVLDVFRKKCREENARLSVVKNPYKGRLGLLGPFQRWNAAAALAVAREMQGQGIEISEKAIEEGLASARWPGRFEVVRRSPTVVLDCAHNPACCVVLRRAFTEAFPGKRALLVFGASSDKNVAGMSKELAQIAGEVFVAGARHRAMAPEKIAAYFGKGNAGVAPGAGGRLKATVAHSVKEAVQKALAAAGKEGVVLVTGSCFVVGEAMQALEND